MPQMNNLNNDNKNNESEDRNHFSEYFDSIIEGLKCHATVMGPDHVQRIKEKLENNPELLASFQVHQGTFADTCCEASRVSSEQRSS